MFVNNFLAPIQVRLSPNFVNHTLGHGDKMIKFWKVKVKGQMQMTLSSSSPSTHSTLTQAFLTFKTLFKVQQISSWMTANLLTINYTLRLNYCLSHLKTNLPKYTTLHLTPPIYSARNLGFIFDEHLTFSDEITSLFIACYYHIRQLRCIQPYLDSSTACTIATSIVHS